MAMDISRRGFVGGLLATCGGAFGACAGATERLRFGVMSDVHSGGKPDAVETLEKALRWFASENVDAVLCPGDIAHSGLIGDLEKFAAAWYKVFPNGMRADGQKVELMISTGNHDVDAFLSTALGDLGRMTRIFGESQLVVKLRLVDRLIYQIRYLFLRVVT